LENAGGSGAPMMPVGDVQPRHGGKLFDDKLAVASVANGPRTVLHPISSHEVDLWRLRVKAGEQIVQALFRRINKECRARLSVQALHVPDAIVLLVRPGQFVSANEAAQVLVATDHRNETELAVLPHDLAVKIESRLSILAKRASLDQVEEARAASSIDLGMVGVDPWREIDLRLADMEEAQRIA
jgi:hypothetical protein